MRRRESKPFRGIRHINEIVPILYRDRDFEAFDDFSDFVESISCESSESCQVRGLNPCRRATCFGAETLSPLVHRKSGRAANYARLKRIEPPIARQATLSAETRLK